MEKPEYYCDVAIVGGGPAGSTVATLLKKYRPKLRVAVFEKEQFPRDHVGESQLPYISVILDEMGVWDQVEAAGFPIKVGATYRWGKSPKLWDFEFLNHGQFEPVPRPSKFEGQRQHTAFQVDRGIYDKILLDHAASVGAEVYQQHAVKSIDTDGDTITSITVQGDQVNGKVEAKYYVDCSGYAGIMRKRMGIESLVPTTLQNIAIWDYWRGASWAVNIGIEGTRVQVMSVGYGWLWFIPLGNDRTSVGLVVPANYYRDRGLRPNDLYMEALANDPVVSKLTEGATREDQLQSTKDWSFLADRLAGDNWFLCGESAGFADPILAAGMTLAHKGARDVAYTILEFFRGEHDEDWLRERYTEGNRRAIMQHIRFADFWYSQNGQFSDLKDYAKEIAGDAGLDMNSDDAWRWLGTGGFVDQDSSITDFAGFSVVATKSLTANFLEDEVHYELFGKTHFRLNLGGAVQGFGSNLFQGRINKHPCYIRDEKYLPMLGVCGWVAHLLGNQERTAREIVGAADAFRLAPERTQLEQAMFPKLLIQTLEAMIADGWIVAKVVPGHDGWPKFDIDESRFMHENKDVAKLVGE
ncbi:MAG: tryptophan 7-halogenase [Armatimonadetes bacterium]|nr:tryptophan 7-halogenase [Armatimonadota bacterium]